MSGGFEQIRNVSDTDSHREYLVPFGEDSYRVVAGVWRALNQIGGKVYVKMDPDQEAIRVMSDLPQDQLPGPTVTGGDIATSSD